MAKHSTDIIRKQVFIDIEVDQAICAVAQPAMKEISILRKECRPMQFVQQRNNLVVIHSLASNAATDFVDANPLALKQLPFIVRKVLVQNIHAGRDSRKYSAA